MRVKLLWVEGDAEEFADLIGLEGELKGPRLGDFIFLPDKRTDWVTLEGATETLDEKGRRRIKTGLGNTFVFRVG